MQTVLGPLVVKKDDRNYVVGLISHISDLEANKCKTGDVLYMNVKKYLPFIKNVLKSEYPCSAKPQTTEDDNGRKRQIKNTRKPSKKKGKMPRIRKGCKGKWKNNKKKCNRKQKNGNKGLTIKGLTTKKTKRKRLVNKKWNRKKIKWRPTRKHKPWNKSKKKKKPTNQPRGRRPKNIWGHDYGEMPKLMVRQPGKLCFPKVTFKGF